MSQHLSIDQIRISRLSEWQAEFSQRDDQVDLPARGSLGRFAEHVELSEAYIGHIVNGRKHIGDATARKLESLKGQW
jgi:hypothetical protein